MYFSNVKLDLRNNNTEAYTVSSVSATIQWHWEYKRQGTALQIPGKPKATRSAFATQEATLDGKAPDAPPN